ncbi:alpha/beta fold hydrolase [Spongisporangium articulatum]|uniref:Alpha/beta fold hydrolase n=1 Tax=Spongisporangium articulatum TaxID=3362603 RepID=A0ABW8AP56_9ACTN
MSHPASGASADRQQPDPAPVVRPVSSWRPDDGLVALGVGIAATGLGAVLGLAAERAAMGRTRAPAVDPDGDGRGGPALGSVHGEARIVISDGVPLHVEVDEPDDAVHGPDESLAEALVERLGNLTRNRRRPTIVMSHGYALTLDSWHYQRLALRGRFRLVLWDQRGHGRSGTGPAGASTIDQIGRDLAAVIDAVEPKGPLVLLGHSMGGMTVMSLAAQRPDLFRKRVRGVALLSTSAGGLDKMDLGLAGFGRLAMRAAPTAVKVLARRPGLVARSRKLGNDLETLLVRRYSFGSTVPPQLVAFAARMIAETRVEVISDFLPTFSTHDKREALSAMREIEGLVMVGDRDLLIPAEQGREIADRLPEAEFVLVPEAGHLLPLEYPGLVNGHIEGLLERAGTGRSARRRARTRRTVAPAPRGASLKRPTKLTGGKAS